MDPVTILGAASSAIGIASFGLQLVQVLTKYADEAGSAAQNLQATLTNIRAASDCIEQINLFLKEESDRVVKQRQKATLLSIGGIRKIQQTTDECLKIFWRIEAWVLDKDDSPELETKITLRLYEYKEKVRENPEEHPQILKVSETLIKVRKLKESRFAKYINPLGEHKLDRYSKDLQRLQVSLNSFFSILNIRTIQNQPALFADSSLVSHMYERARHNAQQAQYANIDLRAEPQQNDATSSEFYSGARDWEAHYLNTRYMPPSSQTHYMPVKRPLVPYNENSFMGTGWPQIPSSFGSYSDIHQRAPPQIHTHIPPTVPDGPWKLSRRRTHVENENHTARKREPKRKDTDRSENSFMVSEYATTSEDPVMDVARSHMAHFDAKVTRKNDDAKIYPGYLTRIEKSQDIDNISIIAQKELKIVSDDEEPDVDDTSSKYYKDKPRQQKQKQRGHSNSRKSTPSKPSQAPWSEDRGNLENPTGRTSSVENDFVLPGTIEVSKQEMQSNDADENYTISDLRNELKIATPLYNRIFENKHPKPEISAKPKFTRSAFKHQEKAHPGTSQDTSGNLIDLSDDFAISQQPTSEMPVGKDGVGEKQSRNAGSKTLNIDLLSGDVEELEIEKLKNPIKQQVILQEETPRETPDDIAELVTTKLLAALPTILVNSAQSPSDSRRPEYERVEDYLVVDEKISPTSEKMEFPATTIPSENATDEKPQITISEISPLNLPPSPVTSLSLTVPHSQKPDGDDNLIVPTKAEEKPDHGVSIPMGPPPLSLEDPPVHSFLPPATTGLAYELKPFDSQSSSTSGSTSSRRRIHIRETLKRVFKRELFSQEDMDRIFPTGSFITAFFIKGLDYHQIPTVGNFKLRKPEIEKMLSQSPEQDWWRQFCFLDADANNSLTQILQPQGSYRRTLIDLKEVKKSPGRLWLRGERAHIAIIINKPLVHLDMAPDSGLDFRSAPTQATTSKSGNTSDAMSLGNLIMRAMEDKDCLMYCAYTIHPRIREISYQPPDWVKAHIIRQNFSKSHILGRILELSTSGITVVAKLLELTMLQQQQIQIVLNSKNDVDGSDVWTLAQLEVVCGQTLKPGNDGIQSITIYLIGDPQTRKNDGAISVQGNCSTSSSETLQNKGADDTASPSSPKAINFMESYEAPQLTYVEPSNLDSNCTDSTLLNSPEPVTAKPDLIKIESLDNEQKPQNHYDALQIPTDATATAIDEAYLSLYRTSHPILNPTDPSAGKRFVEITGAYETLRTATQREAYDREHNLNQTPLESNPKPSHPRPSVAFLETDSQRESRFAKETSSRDGRLPPNSVRYRNIPPRAEIKDPEPFETDNNFSSDRESPLDQALNQSTPRQTRSHSSRRRTQNESPSRRSPNHNRVSLYGDQRTQSPAMRTAQVTRPVDFKQRKEPDEHFGRDHIDWTQRYERGPPPAPQRPRPPPFLLSSQPFMQQPAIPLGRRPASYPDHYDGRSFDPYALPGSENAGDDIVQQLLLEWTPAGEEAEAAEKQSKKEDYDIISDIDLNETFIRNESQKAIPVKKQDKGKQPQRQRRGEAIEGASQVHFHLDNIAETISEEEYYTPRGTDAGSCGSSPGSNSINKLRIPRRADLLKNSITNAKKQSPDSLRAVRTSINDAVSAGSRKATVEDDTGDRFRDE
ncbi:hypothetical protein EAF04_010141 [Stromatinia cepivora]|nr:hypothetical protein EAF04_010141 [Stromatinia cepivora]